MLKFPQFKKFLKKYKKTIDIVLKLCYTIFVSLIKTLRIRTRKEKGMKLSEIAVVIAAVGSLLSGTASMIIALKKEPQEHKRHKARRFK